MKQRPYETMIVIDPNMADPDIEKEVQKVKDTVTASGGEVTTVDMWGRRKLAYEIEGHKDGFYAVIKFKAEPAIVAPLTKAYRLNEGILRHIVVQDNLKEPLGLPEGRRREEDDDEERGGRDFHHHDSRGED